jgi:hypothetical protein
MPIKGGNMKFRKKPVVIEAVQLSWVLGMMRLTKGWKNEQTISGQQKESPQNELFKATA